MGNTLKASSFFAALLLLSTGCSTVAGPWTWAHKLDASAANDRIVPGDVIAVSVQGQEQMSGAFPVRPDGSYTQPMVGPMNVAGLTVKQAAAKLTDKLDGVVVNPVVNISVSTPAAVNVSVVGEVRTPGAVALRPNEGMLEVMARAGGLTEYGSKTGIYVIRQRPEYLRVRFDYDRILGGDPQTLAFKLRDGDVVVVE